MYQFLQFLVHLYDYFKQLLIVAGSAIYFLTYKLKESPKYLIVLGCQANLKESSKSKKLASWGYKY